MVPSISRGWLLKINKRVRKHSFCLLRNKTTLVHLDYKGNPGRPVCYPNRKWSMAPTPGWGSLVCHNLLILATLDKPWVPGIQTHVHTHTHTSKDSIFDLIWKKHVIIIIIIIYRCLLVDEISGLFYHCRKRMHCNPWIADAVINDMERHQNISITTYSIANGPFLVSIIWFMTLWAIYVMDARWAQSFHGNSPVWSIWSAFAVIQTLYAWFIGFVFVGSRPLSRKNTN